MAGEEELQSCIQRIRGFRHHLSVDHDRRAVVALLLVEPVLTGREEEISSINLSTRSARRPGANAFCLVASLPQYERTIPYLGTRLLRLAPCCGLMIPVTLKSMKRRAFTDFCGASGLLRGDWTLWAQVEHMVRTKIQLRGTQKTRP